MEGLKAKIREVPDFPRPGITFYDITTLLRDREGFAQAMESLSKPYQGQPIHYVLGIESRGFIFGGAVADRLRTGFIPVRKVGKLPSRTARVTYDLEYGTDSLEIHEDAVDRGQRVLIVDDLLATGGTAPGDGRPSQTIRRGSAGARVSHRAGSAARPGPLAGRTRFHCP